MNAETTEIYDRAIQVTENLYKQIWSGSPPDLTDFLAQTSRLLIEIETNRAPLLELVLRPFKKNLCHHAVNVAILSLVLGKALKLKPEKLSPLALSGLLFDIGMIKVTGSEMADIKKHPELGAKALAGLPHISSDVIKVILQHHERRDGSGYPQGLKEKEIHPLAYVVGLADTFCTLSHVSPMQRNLSLHETMQELLQGKSLFDPKCLHALLENVTFYPKGTWVFLSTRETGKVVAENAGLPLRPVIKIFLNSDGEKIPEDEERLVDLRLAKPVFIKEVLLEEKLKEKGIDPQWS